MPMPRSSPYEPYLSTTAQNVFRNPIRKIAMKEKEFPGCLSLGNGRPPADVFPTMIQAWGGEELTNYGPSLASGCPELRAWTKEMVSSMHNPPGGFVERDVFMTAGSTDGMTKTLMLLTDPGDFVLADEVTYTGIMASAGPLGRRVRGVPLDKDGMSPEGLEAALSVIAAEGKDPDQVKVPGGGCGSGKARVLYVTPHGQNPTGVTMLEARKDAIYALAQKHELTILEDDPYLFLRLTTRSPDLPLKEENMFGCQDLPGSFLSRDTDGRVVRLDSVSKIIAPGLRLGWVTASKTLLAKWQVLAEVLTWSVSGAQQRALLDVVKGWGQAGFHSHLQQLQVTYARRRSFLLEACERHLTGLCKWSAPDFGMFFWLEILGCEDTDKLVEHLIADYGIAMVPGGAFATPEGGTKAPHRFFRVSFSLLDAEKADKAMLQLKRCLLARQDKQPKDS